MKDLIPMAKGYPHAVNAIRDHAVFLFWKTDLGDDSDAESVVLAYAREVPEQGGQVLMRNGSIRSMTSAEFQAARKPAGATTEDQVAKSVRR